MFPYLQLRFLVSMLLALPITYFVVSYAYLAWWHKKAFLWNTPIHENGRLTMAGSLFYFDHFIGCVPTVVVFAFCIAGGVAATSGVPSFTDRSRAATIAAVLLGIAALQLVSAFVASVLTAGWERTIDYALQRIERDGVMSRGGNWNQLVLSNIPIAFGAIGVSSSLAMSAAGSDAGWSGSAIGGALCMGVAGGVLVGISVVTFPGWQSFLNPRWMAHSIRELATYPLTGIPIALASSLLVARYLSGVDTWLIQVRTPSLILMGAGSLILIWQLKYLQGADVHAMAQRPPFASGGLSIPYLLFSHVFEHFLDFVFIAPLTGGIYALVVLALTSR